MQWSDADIPVAEVAQLIRFYPPNSRSIFDLQKNGRDAETRAVLCAETYAELRATLHAEQFAELRTDGMQ